MRMTAMRERLLVPVALVVATAVAAMALAQTGGSVARAGEPASAAPELFPDGTPRQRPYFEAIANGLDAHGSTDFFPKRKVAELKALVENANLPLRKRIEAFVEYARMLINAGDTEAAVGAIEQAFTLGAELEGGLDQVAAYDKVRALVYLRRAEVLNCIQRRNRDCCVFPLQGGGIHTDRNPAERARESYVKYMMLCPNDLGARWMLNILSMALGEYPQGVPEDLRIPPSAFASQYDIKRFTDIAPQLGIDVFNLAGGTIADDFDNDGFLDIVTSTLNIEGPLHYYHNDGQGGFEDRSDESRLSDQLGGLNCVATDYNNDGFMDILVLRGAWWFEDGRIRKSLLRNNGNGTFTDVTAAAGLAEPAMPTQVGVWADFDNDGDLDLFVGNESRIGLGNPMGNYPSQLFRNNNDGTFTDIAVGAGVTNDRYCKGASAGDYDNDGLMDLYVSNLEENRLYRNLGNMRFEDVAATVGVTEPRGRSFSTWFFDYNNDGLLDIFCSAYDACTADLCAHYLGRPYRASPPALFRNQGNGRFMNVTAEAGLAHPYLPMGANFGDLDNDGWLDMYLGTGDPGYETLMPDIMLRNNQGKAFQDVTQSGGFGFLQKGHGVSFADFDHDGDQDIFHQLGGLFPGDAFHSVFLLNPGHDNHYLTILLEGVKSNRLAIGARVRVVLTTPLGQREIHRAVGSVSSFGGSTFRQEVGLGDAVAISRLEIHWPASGRRQVFENVPLDSKLRVVEDKDQFEVLRLPAFEFAE
ncbi:MAG: CRTAC1 family protein [Phycisphaerales bacterium]|nr:CRTAC1 family protein [Phycisphaerales bacterium]MCI0675346.1 CRTAC1 family protein [Phycisphaerales bacterium]